MDRWMLLLFLLIMPFLFSIIVQSSEIGLEVLTSTFYTWFDVDSVEFHPLLNLMSFTHVKGNCWWHILIYLPVC